MTKVCIPVVARTTPQNVTLSPVAFDGLCDTIVSHNEYAQDSRHMDGRLEAQPLQAMPVVETPALLVGCADSTTVATHFSDSHGEFWGSTGMSHV